MTLTGREGVEGRVKRGKLERKGCGIGGEEGRTRFEERESRGKEEKGFVRRGKRFAKEGKTWATKGEENHVRRGRGER